MMKFSGIDPGWLCHRLYLESKNSIPDGYGGFTTNWQSVACLWAAIKPAASLSRIKADTLKVVISHRITIRWRDDCLPKMRLLKQERKFLINNVYDPDEKKRYLICECEETK